MNERLRSALEAERSSPPPVRDWETSSRGWPLVVPLAHRKGPEPDPFVGIDSGPFHGMHS